MKVINKDSMYRTIPLIIFLIPIILYIDPSNYFQPSVIPILKLFSD